MAHTSALAHAAGLAQTAPIPGLGGRTAFVLIAAVVVVIAALAVIPLIMDVRRATAWRQQLTDHLIDQAATDHDVRDLLRDLREPRGVRGLTRSVIAVLILALVGFALAVAMLSSGADSGDLRKTIVTSLMTVLATVAGFYFGSLGAQNSAEDARRAVRPPTPRAMKAVASANSADAGAAGAAVTEGAAPDSAATGPGPADPGTAAGTTATAEAGPADGSGTADTGSAPGAGPADGTGPAGA